MPQPRSRAGSILLVVLLALVFLAAWAVYIGVFVHRLITAPEHLLPLMFVGLGLSVLWVIFVAIAGIGRD